MTDITNYLIIVASIRIVTILCITKIIICFRNPWLLVLYAIVPMLSHFGGYVAVQAPMKEDTHGHNF